MDHDPDELAVDLKRPHGKRRGSDLRPAQPPEPQPANAVRETAAGSRKRAPTWFRGSLADVLIVVAGLVVLSYGIYDSHGYWVGTPTTATVDRCEQVGDSESGYEEKCTGTWSVDGHSQQGPIEPPFYQNGPSNGASLNVHVDDGTAFTPSSLGKPFYIAIIGGPILLLLGSFGLWRAQRRRDRE